MTRDIVEELEVFLTCNHEWVFEAPRIQSILNLSRYRLKKAMKKLQNRRKVFTFIKAGVGSYYSIGYDMKLAIMKYRKWLETPHDVCMDGEIIGRDEIALAEGKKMTSFYYNAVLFPKVPRPMWYPPCFINRMFCGDSIRRKKGKQLKIDDF